MSNWMIINNRIAKNPFFLEQLDVRIYSLEELGYLLGKNSLFPEDDIMNAKFCFWVDQELQLEELANQLKQVLKTKGSIEEYLEYLLEKMTYFDQIESINVKQRFILNEHCGEGMRHKLIGDQFADNDKYVAALYEYRKSLLCPDLKREKRGVLGSVWHNMGVCYSKLFLFKQAKECFQTAYIFNYAEETAKAIESAKKLSEKAPMDEEVLRLVPNNDLGQLKEQFARSVRV